MTESILTQDLLKSKLHYDAETGVFRWVKNNKLAGYKQLDGYIQILIDRKKYRAHRLAWLYVYGAFPDEIDHINTNPSDNRLSNLRICTRRENILNRGVHKNSLSGIKGVGYIQSTKKWRARHKKNGIETLIGIFDTKEQAQKAYKEHCIAVSGSYFRE